ncbi:hypothetical protein [Calditerricola satsumensis]|uniref:Uncharacterized protein n=1 Tax=Calditerricola satsumensis TaxID=373054 RepID=A0A8J3FBR7_9BACI|nr:hypothetical protein [Calditerricola satsumensis]GGK05913.1 hypothetical protein GCM10007043_19930 [Calditerricola satsumensis]
MWQCPNCKRKDVGKVGSHQFYCWNCLIEYSVMGGQVHVYAVEEDGSLSSLDDLFAPEELRLQP